MYCINVLALVNRLTKNELLVNTSAPKTHMTIPFSDGRLGLLPIDAKLFRIDTKSFMMIFCFLTSANQSTSMLNIVMRTEIFTTESGNDEIYRLDIEFIDEKFKDAFCFDFDELR